MKTKINPDHKHAVVHVESDFGLKIKRVIATYETESAARSNVLNGNKGAFPERILSGQAYARMTDEGWLLDGQTTAAEDAADN